MRTYVQLRYGIPIQGGLYMLFSSSFSVWGNNLLMEFPSWSNHSDKDPTRLRHLVLPIRICWHTSFWTTGWELLSSWVRKLIQKPWNHHNPSVHPTNNLKCKNILEYNPKPDFPHSRVNEWNVYGHLPHKGTAEHSCRGCFQHMWGPCTEYAGCSGVCGQSRPPDAP